MPFITVLEKDLSEKRIEVPVGTKLVTAIKALGIDIGHRCGGNARCTTCRVSVTAGEPGDFTRAEFLKLRGAELLDQVRLSCQVVVTDDMQLTVWKTLQSEGWADTGPAVAVEVTPEAERFARADLEAEVAAV